MYRGEPGPLLCRDYSGRMAAVLGATSGKGLLLPRGGGEFLRHDLLVSLELVPLTCGILQVVSSFSSLAQL